MRWEETNIGFEDRFKTYLNKEFFEHDIHWFSIFNAFMMVIFLCGLVALILVRTLSHDIAKVSGNEARAGGSPSNRDRL